MSTQLFLRQKETPGPEPLAYPHGTRQSYQGTRVHKGCRCQECKDANAAYQSFYRDSQPKQEKPAYVTVAMAEELAEFDTTYGGLMPN